MKIREFYKLPIGRYKLYDGIWNYTLNKTMTEDNRRIIYSVSTEFGNHFSLFESLENVNDDSDKYKRYSLIACANIGGFCLHDHNVRGNLRYFSLVPKSSYKEWLVSVEQSYAVQASVARDDAQ